MKNNVYLTLLIGSACVIFNVSNSNAQIHDIKKNSKENKSNRSNNNQSSNNKSSDSKDNSFDYGGCISGFFDILSVCFNSLPESSGKNNNYSYDNRNNNSYNNHVYISPENQNQVNQKTKPDTLNVIEDKQIILPSENDSSIEDNIVAINQAAEMYDTTKSVEKESPWVSFDINMNCALGFEYSSDKNYGYYNPLPGIRANFQWFLIDYRYNMLAEFSDKLPDSYKTWDLMFLFNIKAGIKTNLVFGTGMHKEQYTGMLYNEHYFGVRTMYDNNKDYLDINGRISIDYKTSEFPLSEIGIHFYKRFLNSKNVNGYFSIGPMYQNYYSSTDIWALQLGVKFNLH